MSTAKRGRPQENIIVGSEKTYGDSQQEAKNGGPEANRSWMLGLCDELCISDDLRSQAFVGDDFLKRSLQLLMGCMVKRTPDQQLFAHFVQK